MSINGSVIKISLVGGCLLLSFFYQNCSKPYINSADQASQSQANLIEQKAMVVLTTRCSSCHNADYKSGGVDVLNINEMLASGVTIPGEPSLSPIFSAIQSGRMPPSKFLSQSEIQAVYDWIADGSKTAAPVTIPNVDPGLGVLLPTFASINKNILQPKCLGCHNSNSTNGVNFSTYLLTLTTVQKTLPLSSGLYTSVATRNTMPKGNSRSLTAAENKAIFDWITAGALNN